MLCEKSTTFKPVSRCNYCNSVSYGTGCRFAPGGVHFHGDDSRKCSYCGSLNYGKGCRFNLVDNTHIHGIQYNSMISEKITNNIRGKFLLKILGEPITECRAFELGVIDQYGRKIKEPVTEEERASYTLLTRTLLSVKKYLGSKLDIILNTTILEGAISADYDKQKHKKLLIYEDRIREKINEIFEIIETATQDGVTIEEIDELLQK